MNTLYADIDVNGDGVINAQDCLAGFPVACRVGNSFTQIKTSTAVYTDMKYRLTDHITLRGGLRYTRDDGRLGGFESQFQDVQGTSWAIWSSPATLRRKARTASSGAMSRARPASTTRPRAASCFI